MRKCLSKKQSLHTKTHFSQLLTDSILPLMIGEEQDIATIFAPWMLGREINGSQTTDSKNPTCKIQTEDIVRCLDKNNTHTISIFFTDHLPTLEEIAGGKTIWEEDNELSNEMLTLKDL